MASNTNNISEFFSSSSTNNDININNNNNININNTILFPNLSHISGLVPEVPPEEDFVVPYCFNDFGFVDGFCSSEKLGFCDGVVPSFSAEFNNNNNNNINIIRNNNNINNNGIIMGAQNFGGLGYNNINNNVTLENEFDQFCMTSFLPEFKPFSQNNSEMQSNIIINQVNNGIEESMKVSKYSEEERKERIVRYLKKRNQRNFNKTIKYACRKTLADRRVRVRGRFARNNNEILHDQKMVAEKIIVNNDSSRNDVQIFCEDSLQMIKFDEDEEWLQNFALCC